MPLSESEIITRYFQPVGLAADASLDSGIVLGIGDDCALLDIPDDKQLAISMDVLVEGRHFPVGAPADLIAKRALAVNLSDLAAMGAEPFCFTLGLTLPAADSVWLEDFSRGLSASAAEYRCPLVGGNLAKGPLQIAIQVQGLVPKGKGILRSKARAGHDIYVSGEPGRAGLALEYLQGKCPQIKPEQEAELLAAYYQPIPRLKLGVGLRNKAGAMQDVSDGLLLDLKRMAEQSKVCMTINIAALPLGGVLTALRSSMDVFRLILSAGDDYELIFTAPPSKKKAVIAAAKRAGVRVSCIGKVSKGEGVEVLDLTGRSMSLASSGYEHFAQDQK